MDESLNAERPSYSLSSNNWEVMDETKPFTHIINVWDIIITYYADVYYVESVERVDDSRVRVNGADYVHDQIKFVITPQQRNTFKQWDAIKSAEWYYSKVMDRTDKYYILSERTKNENPGDSMSTFAISVDKFEMMAAKFEYVAAKALEVQLTQEQLAIITWGKVRYFGDWKNIPRTDLESGKRYYFEILNCDGGYYYIGRKNNQYIRLHQNSWTVPTWARVHYVPIKTYEDKVISSAYLEYSKLFLLA